MPGRVEIAGGGFGGLVAAIAFADRGWQVCVHERRAAVHSEGFGISIQRNMTHIFRTFGILDTILAGGAHIDRRDSLDRNGRVLMSRPTERSPWRVDRGHIVTLLAERARTAGAEIRLNSTVTAAEADGTVVTATGETRKADLVIVADGVNSALRDRLDLLESRRMEPDGAVRVAIPRLPEEIAAADAGGTPLIEAWADKRRVLYCPVDRERFYVLLGSLARDAEARKTPIDPAVWARSFPTMRGLFERIAAQAEWSETRWAQFQTIKLRRWSTGRVAVLGDAAHAMPPYLGQGAGHAMMNALGLAVAVEDAPDLATALDIWERRERPLTEHTQRWTRIYGTTILLPGPLKQLAIRAEQRIPWIAAQYARTANHLPSGCSV